MTERFLRWMGFGFLFALIPLGWPFIGAEMMGKPTPDLYQLVKHGDTYLFCAIVTMAAIGELISIKLKHAIPRILVAVLGAGIVFIATMLYTSLSSGQGDDPTIDKGRAVMLAFLFLLFSGIVAGACIILSEERQPF